MYRGENLAATLWNKKKKYLSELRNNEELTPYGALLKERFLLSIFKAPDTAVIVDKVFTGLTWSSTLPGFDKTGLDLIHSDSGYTSTRRIITTYKPVMTAFTKICFTFTIKSTTTFDGDKLFGYHSTTSNPVQLTYPNGGPNTELIEGLYIIITPYGNAVVLKAVNSVITKTTLSFIWNPLIHFATFVEVVQGNIRLVIHGTDDIYTTTLTLTNLYQGRYITYGIYDDDTTSRNMVVNMVETPKFVINKYT